MKIFIMALMCLECISIGYMLNLYFIKKEKFFLTTIFVFIIMIVWNFIHLSKYL